MHNDRVSIPWLHFVAVFREAVETHLTQYALDTVSCLKWVERMQHTFDHTYCNLFLRLTWVEWYLHSSYVFMAWCFIQCIALDKFMIWLATSSYHSLLWVIIAHGRNEKYVQNFAVSCLLFEDGTDRLFWNVGNLHHAAFQRNEDIYVQLHVHVRKYQLWGNEGR